MTPNSGHRPLSPGWVGVALMLLPPLGFYLLWNHPSLSKSKGWWASGLLWSVFWLYANARRPAGVEPNPTPAVNGRTHATDSVNEISAEDLVGLRNSAAIRNKFTGRFVVTGRIMNIEDESSGFGRRKYMVSLVGTLNSRDLVNSWVECVMSKGDGLDRLGPGHFVKIEGEFDHALGKVVYLKSCCLFRQYHDD